MPGCKVLTRNCWFDVTETPSKYFGFLACLYAWQINQQVCRMASLRLPIIIHFSNHCMLMCDDALSTISTLANWILLSVKVVCYLRWLTAPICLMDLCHITSSSNQRSVFQLLANGNQGLWGPICWLMMRKMNGWQKWANQWLAMLLFTIVSSSHSSGLRFEMRLLLSNDVNTHRPRAGWWWHY